MLGLFYEIYRDRDGASRDAWAVVAPRADELYPRTFTWATAAWRPAARARAAGSSCRARSRGAPRP